MTARYPDNKRQASRRKHSHSQWPHDDFSQVSGPFVRLSIEVSACVPSPDIYRQNTLSHSLAI